LENNQKIKEMQALTNSSFHYEMRMKNNRSTKKTLSLSPDRLCCSSVLSPRAGMRKDSTQVKSSVEVKQFCLLALGQHEVPQTAME